MDSDMPTKDTEKMRNAAVYIDGKPIKGIQEIRPRKITVKRSFAYRLIKLMKSEVFIFVFKLRHKRKGR